MPNTWTRESLDDFVKRATEIQDRERAQTEVINSPS